MKENLALYYDLQPLALWGDATARWAGSGNAK